MKTIKIWILFTLLLSLFNFTTQSQTINPDNDPNFHLAWQDDFNSLDSNIWIKHDIFDHYGEPQVFLHNNSFVSNGNLNIVIKHENFHADSSLLDEYHCKHQMIYGTDYEYTSGWLESKQGFDVRMNSYVEARVKSPYLKSMNAAFWLFMSKSEPTGIDYNEIDIFEIIGELGKDSTTSNIHWRHNDGNDQPHISLKNLGIMDNYNDVYITYGALWRADSIIFYINHKRSLGVKNKGQMNAQRIIFGIGMRYNKTTGIEYFPQDSLLCPDTMFVDYVRVYDYNPDSTYTTNKQKEPYIINSMPWRNYLGNYNSQAQIMWQLNQSTYDLSNGTCRIKLLYSNSYVNKDPLLQITGDHLFSTVLYGLPGTVQKFIIQVLDTNGLPIANQPFTDTCSVLFGPSISATSTKFYAYGDTRGYSNGNAPDHHNAVCGTILNEINADPSSQTLLLHAGDWNNSDTEHDWNTEYFNSNDQNAIKLRSKIAIMGVKGNHEKDGNRFKKYFPFPYQANYKTGNDFSYTFDYGPVHFVMMYVNGDGYDLNAQEINWLDSVLANTDKKWKVLMFHAPVKTLRKGLADPATASVIKQKAKQYGVQLVLMGHEHYYSHWVDDGTHYMILGGGGAYIEGVKLDSVQSSDEVFASTMPHFAKFSVKNDVMMVDVIQGDDGLVYNNQLGRRIEKFAIPVSTQISDTVLLDNPADYPIVSDIITVKAGGELHVKSNIEMTKNGQIIVEPQAKLLIEDSSAIISSYKRNAEFLVYKDSAANYYTEDETYWRGIEVWGDRSQNQFYSNGRAQHQGEVIVKNGASIENAEVAIAAIKTNDDGVSHDWSKTGGIIRVDSARFINNFKDVWMGGYHNLGSSGHEMHNFSYIKNCYFEKNDSMLTGHSTGEFVGLYDLGTVTIQGNTFKSTRNSQNTTNKGRGIVLYSASVNLGDYCPSSGNSYTPLSQSMATGVTPCTNAHRNYFEGLYYGIKATSVTGFPNSIISVDRAEFDNVYHGVYIQNSKYSVLTRNDFKIANSDPAAGTGGNIYDAYGLYLDGSDAYKVEENSFDKVQSNQGLRGIVINGSGGNNNEIYRNTLVNLGYSIQPQETNRNHGGSQGLGIYCDSMLTNAYDISVLDSGIAEHQQIFNTAPNNNVPYFAAGNSFSTDSNNVLNYQNQNAWAKIFYYPDADHIPQRVHNVSLPPLNATLPTRSCPIKLYNTTLPVLTGTTIPQGQLALNSATTLLNIWRNGGEANLDEQVETTLPWDVYVEFNHLIAKSPYLSDEVLLEVIHNSAFTSLMVKLIMVANPHSAHNPEIWDALINRMPAMPEAYLLEIEQGGEGISQLEVLEGNVAACKHALDMAINDAKRLYRMDYEDGGSIDNMINFVARLAGLSNAYELAAPYLEKKDYTQMQNTLNSIPSNFALSEQQWAEHNNWISYFAIAKSLRQKEVPFDGLTQNQKDVLGSIIESNPNTEAASAALALLIFNNPEYDYVEPVKEFSMENQRKARPKSKLLTTDKTKLIELYPNPAHDYITLRYSNMEQYNSLSFSLNDQSGKMLLNGELNTRESETLLNLYGLKAGIYTLIFYGDGKMIETHKITIIN